MIRCPQIVDLPLGDTSKHQTKVSASRFMTFVFPMYIYIWLRVNNRVWIAPRWSVVWNGGTYVRSLIHTPLKGLSKKTTNDLLFCCFNVIYFVYWVLCSYKSKHRHTHTHTHHTARLDLAIRWLHHCFMSNMGWWWQMRVWGMERVWNGVWNEKRDPSWLSKSLIIKSSNIE